MSIPSPLPDFLTASGLPARWQGRERLVVLDLGPGAAARFEVLRAAWCADPLRCERLIVLALDGPDSTDHADGRVQWMRLSGEPETALRGVQAQVDAFWLGEALAVSDDLLKRLHRLAAPAATLWSARPDTDWHTRFPPRYIPPRPAAFRPPHQGPREALVIGAGLAGCAAAWALARQGWYTTLLDRQAAPAQETSGNPGGLMHGTFNAPDSLHARWFRAASLLTARLARPAIASGAVAGDLSGLVRLENRIDAAQAAAQLAQVGLSAEYVLWISIDEARACTGLPVESGGWFYTQAGWLSPSDWSRWLLAQAVSAGLAQFRGQMAVEALRRSPAGGWQALDSRGRVLAEAPIVVLANAHTVDHLLSPHSATTTALQAVRGQTTLLGADTPGLCPPRRALSGQGYGLTLPDGRVLTGATSRSDDLDGTLRAADQQRNLERAARLGICPAALASPMALPVTGRVGWRATTPDRLPLIGPPVDRDACDAARLNGRIRLDKLRHLPRCQGADHGLFVFAGLGSRGITSAALGAQVLAAWVSGAPFPVEAALRDALDPAR
ncbi:FAD-dependent 5-carboxymethylaminomethyl-2-thiouridine(34) oxidoreductase MnmC [Sphaerotilus sp.]|uniref:FAD-dependent 5-carboxymethylaminomethyl-2-thiouridine(34) oxidoreductase MnmC n=1 Tax=Sphaerotilus sp. TaxID=2093942 RepID=UPI00286E2F4C|nr:FAD-dependent 5-carboxymethylaminomethyl-2-thiouridine(34) oxidoreductase MnmC [Sphaerotilus sp.]